MWAFRFLAAGSFVVLGALWWWASHRQLLNPLFLPTPESVLTAARTLFAEDSMWLDVRASFLRVSAGFVLSVVMAIPLGILIGSFRVCEALVQPMAEFVRYIPVPALIPVFMVIFGIGEFSKIMLIWVGTFFQLLLMVSDEVRRVPQDLLQVSYTLGARREETMRLVLWRCAMPGIFDALRLAHGWAWTYVVVAELVAANEGLGYRILKFSRFLQTPKIWVYLLVLGLVGLALDFLFRSFNRRLFHWADTSRR
ncbi:MAG TPA: ABC transporter permease [Chthoniobacteraceae bacterium]|jgi:NitT/TauT family transport system permease protein